jgi:hypothetical protein
LTEVLRAILLDTDTEVTEHKDPYHSEKLINKDHIQENQKALRNGIDKLAAPKSSQEYSSESRQGID